MNFPYKVKYSKQGLEALGKNKANKTGTALRRQRRGIGTGCIVVNWDGNKPNSICSIHEDFIEPITNQPTPCQTTNYATTALHLL